MPYLTREITNNLKLLSKVSKILNFIIICMYLLQELQNDGGMVSSCINSACLSLLDASVSLKFLVAAVSCSLRRDGSILLDPTSKQIRDGVANIVFVFESKTRSVISTHSEGPVNSDKFQECLAISKTAVEKIFQFYRIVIGKKFSKDV